MDGTSDKLLRQLKFMRTHIAALNVLAKAGRLRQLATKAGFRPNQARAPAGRPDGGQWIDEGSPLSQQAPRTWLAGGHPELPSEIPPEPPPTIKERNAWGVRVAKYLAATSPTLAETLLVEWLVSHAGHRIRAYLEPAKSLEELQDAALNPKPASTSIILSSRRPRGRIAILNGE
jgi:hypothetical protein